MPLNGDAVVQDGQRKMNMVSHKLLHLLNDALEHGAGLIAGKIQSAQREAEKLKLMESYGVNEEFRNYMKKGGQMSSLNVSIKDYLDFARECKKRDVPFMTITTLGKDFYTVCYRATDAEKVERSIKAFEEGRALETEMTPERFEEKYAGRGVFSVSGISLVELELIRHYAAENNFQYAAEAINDGNECKILFNDKAKLDEVLKKMAWQLSDTERGPLEREQIEYRIAGRNHFNHELCEDAAKEFYIASKQEPTSFVHVTVNEIEVYKDNKSLTTISRSDADAYEKAVTAMANMKEPVMLEADEWASRQRLAIISARQEVIPTGLSAADGVAQDLDEKERQAWEVMNRKVSIDKAYGWDESSPKENTVSKYNDTFKAEFINDGFEKETEHAAEAAAYLYNKKLVVEEEIKAHELVEEQPSKELTTEPEREESMPSEEKVSLEPVEREVL